VGDDLQRSIGAIDAAVGRIMTAAAKYPEATRAAYVLPADIEAIQRRGAVAVARELPLHLARALLIAELQARRHKCVAR
jgi:hypothetical protein